MNRQKDHVVLSLSGGLDSSTLLLRCLSEYKSVTAISFDYGQKHRVELERAQSLVDYINSTLSNLSFEEKIQWVMKNRDIELENLAITEAASNLSPITYRQIQLNGLVDLLDSTLVTGGEDVPEGHYAEDNMKATVVPNRNKIFASITQAIALSVANRTGETCDIALGIHAGDFSIYPDCRAEFRDADDNAFRLGNWGAEKVGYFTPYLEGNKFTILQDGEVLCRELSLNFNEVYSRTNTSYKPYPSGNSDYKSASSVERVEAFIKLGRPDPVIYEDEDGIASWDKVVTHAKKILNNHNN
jgi:7-cyano-7-deazaguanine synthase